MKMQLVYLVNELQIEFTYLNANSYYTNKRSYIVEMSFEEKDYLR